MSKDKDKDAHASPEHQNQEQSNGDSTPTEQGEEQTNPVIDNEETTDQEEQAPEAESTPEPKEEPLATAEESATADNPADDDTGNSGNDGNDGNDDDPEEGETAFAHTDSVPASSGNPLSFPWYSVEATSTPNRIDYESLGIHLGLNDAKEKKKRYLKTLKKSLKQISKSFEVFGQKTASQQENFNTKLKMLNQDLIDQLRLLEQLQNQSITRMLAHGGALRRVMEALDSNDKSKLLEAAIEDMTTTTNTARRALETYQRQLTETFSASVLRAHLQQVRKEQEQLLNNFLANYQFKQELETGFLYGQSVRAFLGGEPSSTSDENGPAK